MYIKFLIYFKLYTSIKNNHNKKKFQMMISKVNILNPVSFKKETDAEEIIFIDESTSSKSNNPNPEPFKKEHVETTLNNNSRNQILFNPCCNHLARIEELELELNKKSEEVLVLSVKNQELRKRLLENQKLMDKFSSNLNKESTGIIKFFLK